jgi:hypothetical protein
MQHISIRLSGAFFLILQAVLYQIIWIPETVSAEIFLTFTVLSILAGLAALGFFFLQQTGWLLAIVTQGVSLTIAIFIYFIGSHPLLAQITMAYCIFMVLYLNLLVIRSAFRGELNTPDTIEENL